MRPPEETTILPSLAMPGLLRMWRLTLDFAGSKRSLTTEKQPAKSNIK
jgi:hypothetical protein